MPSEGSALSSVASGSRAGSLAKRARELRETGSPPSAARPGGSPEDGPPFLGWVRPLPRSAWLLVAANLVPLAGVLLLGWDLGTIMVLFWAENIVIGFYAILRVALVARWSALFLVPFFAVHYGIFTAGHGLFVFTVFAADTPFAELARAVVPGVVALLASHGWSFVANFLRGGEMRRMRDALALVKLRKSAPGTWTTELVQAEVEEHSRGFLDASQLMTAPYRRILVMHLTIIGGGFLLLLLRSPVWALALLVVLKTVMDLRAHVKERERAGPAELGANAHR